MLMNISEENMLSVSICKTYFGTFNLVFMPVS